LQLSRKDCKLKPLGCFEEHTNDFVEYETWVGGRPEEFKAKQVKSFPTLFCELRATGSVLSGEELNHVNIVKLLNLQTLPSSIKRTHLLTSLTNIIMNPYMIYVKL